MRERLFDQIEYHLEDDIPKERFDKEERKEGYHVNSQLDRLSSPYHRRILYYTQLGNHEEGHP